MEACVLLIFVLQLVNADNGGDTSTGGRTSPAFFSANDSAESYVRDVVRPDDHKERFSQCEFMKKLFGVSYNQMVGDKAPSLANLSLVYRTRNGNKIFKMDAAAESLRREAEFAAERRLVIFVHGFTDDPSKEAFTKMAQVFLASGHVNMIALDASSLVSWIYLRATAYVRFIGQKLGQVLADIFQQGHDSSDIHIIGHSLGAHIAGFAGKAFRELTGRLLGRISGLDPAGPCFNAVHPDARLTLSDAEFVAVTHTDAVVYGIKEPVGHVDYYPNGGWSQPNCLSLLGCSHIRALVLFAESVLYPHAFPALRCRDWDAFKRGQCTSDISYMGYPSKSGANSGLYFLQTGANYPYGLGLNGTKYKKTSLFW